MQRETNQQVASEELLENLTVKYFNTFNKVKKINGENLLLFFEAFKSSQNPLVLCSKNLSVSFLDKELFLLNDTKAINHNASCVVRDILTILYDGEKRISMKDIQQRIVFH